jgi:hypothetical protein
VRRLRRPTLRRLRGPHQCSGFPGLCSALSSWVSAVRHLRRPLQCVFFVGFRSASSSQTSAVRNDRLTSAWPVLTA